MTVASEKSYIQAKSGSTEKAYCLVNINSNSCNKDHGSLCKAVLTFACDTSDLTKDMVVAQRNVFIAESW